jgi:hypothetical protein
MALTNAVIHAGPVGTKLQVFLTCTGDTSYPTGGYSLKPGDFPSTTGNRGSSRSETLRSFTVVRPAPSTHGYAAWYDATAQKLKVFSAAGTEVANNTNLSAEVFPVEILGNP